MNLTTLHKGLIALSALIFILYTFLFIYHWNNLPAKVPIHYNWEGDADVSGSRYALWGFPVLNIALFLLFLFLAKRPHLFQYSQSIPLQYKAQAERIATDYLWTTFLLLTIIFAGLMWITLQHIAGKMQGLFVGFLPLVIVAIIALSIYFQRRVNSLSKK